MTKTQNIKQGYKHTAIGILPKDWEVVRLGEVGDIIGGGTPDTKNSTFWNGEILWLTPTEIKQKYISTSERKITQKGLANSSAKLLPKNTILITTRATIGDIGIATQELCTNQGFQSFVSGNKVDFEFMYYLLGAKRREFVALANGSTFLEISAKAIRQIQIPLPPLKEQEKIARILSAWDNAIATLDSLIKAKQRYKKALMQRLLTPPCEVKTDKSPLPCGGDLGVGKIAQDKAKSTLDSFDITHPLALSAREGGQEANRTQKAPPLAGGVGVGYPHTNNNRNDESLTPSLRDSQCESNQSKSYRHCEALQKPKQSTQSLRFAGFTDNWQEFRIGDILQEKNARTANNVN